MRLIQTEAIMEWLKSWAGRRRNSDDTGSRVESLLLHDAAAVSPALLELIRNEIVQTVSRHMDVDYELVEVRLVQAEGGLRLLASLPLRSPGQGPPRRAAPHA